MQYTNGQNLHHIVQTVTNEQPLADSGASAIWTTHFLISPVHIETKSTFNTNK